MLSVCFCGMDGSGKSSQIGSLRHFLVSSNKEVAVSHIFSGESTVISKYHNRGFTSRFISFIRGLPDNPIGTSIKVTSRLVNLLIDSWLTYFRDLKRYPQSIVIYDRYFYDILVVLASDYPRLEKLLLSFAKLIPRPRGVILLNLKSGVAVSRKNELTPEKASAYERLYQLLGERLSCSVIDSGLSMESVWNKIRQSLGGILR